MTQNHAGNHVGSSPTIGTNNESVRNIQQILFFYNKSHIHNEFDKKLKHEERETEWNLEINIKKKLVSDYYSLTNFFQ